MTIAAATAAGSREPVCGSTSAKTGTASRYSGAEAVAIQLIGGTITSSPGPTPAARSATSRVTVPFMAAIP